MSEKPLTEENSFPLETVLVMQGGGSLGAYECRVYKSLARHGKKFDVVAGTSIGAINAAIITASTEDENPARKLEDFWLEVSQSIGPPIPMFLSDKKRSIISTTFAAMWGNPKAFIPRWFKPDTPFNYQISFGLPYPLLDITPLKQTVPKYVDFAQLKKKGPSSEEEKLQGPSSNNIISLNVCILFF